ncbi:MAG: O-methyltransferase [Ruminococcaceae bacterium]|nr:O-methyltransferase [Oscillospiraceae bacterium]
MDNQITYPYIDTFLHALQPPEDAFLRELEALSRKEDVPSAVRTTARLLHLLVGLKKPVRILEIGTAIGYSALTMYLGSGKKAQIVTIEKDEERFLMARNHFRSYGALQNIKPICGDAEEILSTLTGPFDMVFIDAAKSASRRYFDMALSLAAPDALIVTDNVLYGGRTAREGEPEHKHRTGVKAMQEYLDYLCHDERFFTAVLPVGDGVAITMLQP